MLLADAPEQVFGIFKLLSYPHRFGNDHGDGIERAFTTDLDPVGRTIVDVGLLDCHAVVDAVRRGFVVHAFEPVPSYMANCRRMLKRNSFVDAPISAGTPLLPARWHNRQREILNRRPSPRDGFAFLYAAALSNVTMGAVPFYEAGGSSSFASRGIRKHNITRIEVPVIRLDDAVDENLWLLKVDTQGHEWHVFSGASRLFARRTVAHVLTEFDPRLLRRQQVRSRLGAAHFTTRPVSVQTDAHRLGTHRLAHIARSHACASHPAAPTHTPSGAPPRAGGAARSDTRAQGRGLRLSRPARRLERERRSVGPWQGPPARRRRIRPGDGAARAGCACARQCDAHRATLVGKGRGQL